MRDSAVENLTKTPARDADRLRLIQRHFIERKTNPELTGNFNKLGDANILFGWAALKNSCKRLTVAILVDDRDIIIAQANIFRAYLATANVNDGCHGFEVPIPLYLCDANEHKFSLFDFDSREFIVEKKYVMQRKSVDFSEIRSALTNKKSVLLVYDFQGKGDLLALGRAARERVREDLTVVAFEYALSEEVPSRSLTEVGLEITTVACSPGLSESEVFSAVLQASVLSGLSTLMIAHLGGPNSETIFDDLRRLPDGSALASIGLIAHTLERTTLSPQAAEVYRDWCKQLGYKADNVPTGLRCDGLITIAPALLSEMGALTLKSHPEYFESLASQGGLMDLVYGFIELLARHGHLQVTSYPDFDKAQRQLSPSTATPKFIAFYLPQYHPIPENDVWWGNGFTEWRNVTRATPFFDGHDQPRTPADLGYYDLRLSEIQHQQAKMAKAYGLHGFCYYYYWFDGVRLLNRPIDSLMRPDAPDFNFCLCWANENWTRNWDGLNRHVLIEQNYSFESNRRFIHEVIPILADPRYIRVEGKPILVVYRILHIENWNETASMWRDECRAFGLGEIHLAAVRTNFDALSSDPNEYGLDSFVLFPPHQAKNVSVKETMTGVKADFSGQIFDYESVVSGDLEKYANWKGGMIHRGVMMAWDNTARRMQHASVYSGATPMKFRAWLKGVLEQEGSRQNSSPFVFINAWNEWAEGTYLEPDTKYRYAYLEVLKSFSSDVATSTECTEDSSIGEKLPRHLQLTDVTSGGRLPDIRRRLSSSVLSGCEYRQGHLAHRNPAQTILVCGHQLDREGSVTDRSLLEVLGVLAANKYDVVTILPSFDDEVYVRDVCRLSRSLYKVPYKTWQYERSIDERLVLDVSDILITESVHLLYANTAFLREPIIAAKRQGKKIAIHLRELVDRNEGLCNQAGLPAATNIIDEIKAAAELIVADSIEMYCAFRDHENVYLVNNYNPPALNTDSVEQGNKLRFGMIGSNISKEGFIDFISIANAAIQRKLPIEFIYIDSLNTEVKKTVSNHSLPTNLKLIDVKDGISAAFDKFDILLGLYSPAENIHGTVAAALGHGKPALVYQNNMLAEIVKDEVSGFVVPYRCTDSVLQKITFLLENRNLISTFELNARNSIKSNYSQHKFGFHLNQAIVKILPPDTNHSIEDVFYKQRATPLKPRPVSIIIPIFKRNQRIKDCIESVIKNVPTRSASVILIVNRNTDQSTKEYLRNIARNIGYRLIESPSNASYADTLNLGIREAPDDDIVLLDSSTEVTNGWLTGLRVAAYSNTDVGTVSAMSDNAGPFSFPNPDVKNKIPPKIPRNEISDYILSRTAPYKPIDVATGSSFCLYIKHSLLSDIEHFSQATSPRTAGEEIDFWMGARLKGWRHLITPWSYVYHHEHSASDGKSEDDHTRKGVAHVLEPSHDDGITATAAFSSKDITDLRNIIESLFHEYS